MRPNDRRPELSANEGVFSHPLNDTACMFVDDPSMIDSLLRMIRGITSHSPLRQDLSQEALIHLWLIETRRPGQTKSWYLQSCKFHLRHYLASGRSVDSPKRSRGHLLVERDSQEEQEFPELVGPGDSVLSLVSARDLISVLSANLSPHENAVLNCLADGLGVREIGRKLEMSHSMAIKHRSKIASLLVKLEHPSFLQDHLPRANGAKHASEAKGTAHGDSTPSANGEREKSLTEAISQQPESTR